jgi:hypothetical protein
MTITLERWQWNTILAILIFALICSLIVFGYLLYLAHFAPTVCVGPACHVNYTDVITHANNTTAK